MLLSNPNSSGMSRTQASATPSNVFEPPTSQYTMNIFSPVSEVSFPTLHKDIIASWTQEFLEANESIEIQKKTDYGDMSTILKENSSILSDVLVTSQLGFPDVVYPDYSRNEIYIKLCSGDFSNLNVGASQIISSSGSGKNTEVAVELRTNTAWSELIKLDIKKPTQNKNGPTQSDKPFTFSYLPLFSANRTFIPDGEHNLILVIYDKQSATPEVYSRVRPTFVTGQMIPEVTPALSKLLIPLTDIFQANAETKEYEELVHNALVTLLGIVFDRQFTNFKPVVNLHIDHHFTSTTASNHLLQSSQCLLNNPTSFKNAHPLRCTMKVGTQTLVVQHFPSLLTKLAKVSKGKIVMWKLLLQEHIVMSPIFEGIRITVAVIAVALDKLHKVLIDPSIYNDPGSLAQEHNKIEYLLGLLSKLLESFQEFESPTNVEIVQRLGTTALVISSVPIVFPATYPFPLLNSLPPKPNLNPSNTSNDPNNNSSASQQNNSPECIRRDRSGNDYDDHNHLELILEVEGKVNFGKFLTKIFKAFDLILKKVSFPSNWLNINVISHKASLALRLHADLRYEWERYAAFCDQMHNKHPNAEIIQSQSVSTDELAYAKGQYLQITRAIAKPDQTTVVFKNPEVSSSVINS
ncbi:hypothetical protein PSTG_05411 [Puccinia striiformis f. sp. tritici PST-78]|uniref:Uncharacterized protein n=1 Tax=Puccinia striiformis f. sp. tritici PST-78 TaxID=1165861 RepID=A0A0L0VQ24_9BASI|nr:hypothetical protein PSTG_05411 [Puccinia striiformis f. sp. tritici PST-78]